MLLSVGFFCTLHSSDIGNHNNFIRDSCVRMPPYVATFVRVSSLNTFIMNREIKFRAYVGGRGAYPLMGFRKHIHGTTIYPIDSEGLEMDDWYFMDKQELHIEQYTGLKDKNGKEIYEGDICEIRYKSKSIEAVKGTVEWFKLHTHFSLQGTNSTPYSLSMGGSLVDGIYVIGNIHQDKHLLK